jgi:hypothetical protein
MQVFNHAALLFVPVNYSGIYEPDGVQAVKPKRPIKGKIKTFQSWVLK